MTDRKLPRVAREPMRGAPALVTFSAVARPELVQDFLKPPAEPGTQGVAARFRYPDRAGATKVYDWALEGQEGKSVTLPDSDLTVSLSEIVQFPTQERGLDRMLGTDPIPIALFKIQKAGGEPATHMALANLPMVPNLIPSQEDAAARRPRLAAIHYIVAPGDRPQVGQATRADRHPRPGRPGQAPRPVLSRLRPGQGGPERAAIGRGSVAGQAR